VTVEIIVKAFVKSARPLPVEVTEDRAPSVILSRRVGLSKRIGWVRAPKKEMIGSTFELALTKVRRATGLIPVAVVLALEVIVSAPKVVPAKLMV